MKKRVLLITALLLLCLNLYAQNETENANAMEAGENVLLNSEEESRAENENNVQSNANVSAEPTEIVDNDTDEESALEDEDSSVPPARRKPHLYFNVSLSGSVNYPGLSLSKKLYYSIPLIQSSHMLFKTSKIDIGIRNDLTPSYDYLFAYVTVEPIAIFDVTVTFGMKGYLPPVGPLTGLTAPISSYSDDWRGPNAVENARADLGLWVKIYPSLKLKVGPMILMHYFTLSYLNIFENTYLHDSTYSVNLYSGDILMTHETYLLFEIGKYFLAGFQHYYMNAPKSHVYNDGKGYWHNHIDLMGAFQYKDFGANKNLSVSAALLVGFWLKDRYFSIGRNVHDTILGGIYIAATAGLTVKIF